MVRRGNDKMLRDFFNMKKSCHRKVDIDLNKKSLSKKDML